MLNLNGRTKENMYLSLTLTDSKIYLSIFQFYLFFGFRSHSLDTAVFLFFSSALLLVSPFISTLVAPMYRKVGQDLIIHRDLPPPMNKNDFIVAYILFSSGIFILVTGFSLGNISSNVTLSSIFATLLILYLAMSVGLIHWFSSSFIVSIWLTKFIANCKFAATEPQNMAVKIQKILQIYRNLEQTLGPYFASCFTIFQLNWIIVLYIGFTAYFSNYETLHTTLVGLGAIITALGGIRNCKSVLLI